MAFTTLPTRGPADLGAALSDVRAPVTNELSAVNLEKIKDRIIEIGTALGIDARSANGAVRDTDFAGSAIGEMTRVGTRTYQIQKINYSGSGAPGASNDSTQGYQIGSRWFDTDAAAPGPVEWTCVNAKPASAVWVRGLRQTEGDGPLWLAYTGISPAAISGATNDWSPTNLATTGTIRVDLSGNAVLSSIALPAEGRYLILETLASAYSLTLLHDDGATGTAANRILCPQSQDLVLGSNAAVLLRYDETSTRWRVIATSGAFPKPVTHSGATLTLTNAHHGQTWYFTHATGCQITVPHDLIPGFSFQAVCVTTGMYVEFVASGGQVLHPPTGYLSLTTTVDAAIGVQVRSATYALVTGFLDT